jgi:chromosome segregation ATPase
MKPTFDLDFQGTKFTVPKVSLFNFFQHRPELFTATSYKLESAIPLPVFEAFVKTLEENTKFCVTKENVLSISVLAKEFCLEELSTECSTLLSTLDPLGTLESISVLSQRISELESRLSSSPSGIVPEVNEVLTNHERQLEDLLHRISSTESAVTALRFDERKNPCERLVETPARLESESATETDITAWQSELDLLKRSFGSLQSDLEEIRSTTSISQSRIGMIQSEVNSLTESFQGLRNDLEKVRSVSATQDNVAIVNSEINRLKESFQNFQCDLDKLKSISPSHDNVAVVQSEVDRLKETFRSDLENLKSIYATRSRVDDLRTDILTTRDALRSLQSDFDKVKSGSATDRNVSLLQSEFNTLRDSFAALQSDVRRLVPRPSEPTGSIDRFSMGIDIDSEKPRRAASTPSVSPDRVTSHERLQFTFEKPLFGKGNALEGILAHLTKQQGGNIHDLGIIQITSSSIEGDNPEYAAKNIANFTDQSRFSTKNLPYQWVCLNFRRMKVIPTHYTMVTHHDVKGDWVAQYPRSWLVEGSNDQTLWTVLDERSKTSQLDGPDRTSTFNVTNSIECQYIRLTQTGQTSRGKLSLELYAFELFGTLVT